MVFDITHPSPNALFHFAIIVFSISCTPKSKKMLDCVSAYSKALNLHWTKAFGEGCVKSKTKVKQNLFVVVIDYYKKLHLKQFQEKKKRVSQESI